MHLAQLAAAAADAAGYGSDAYAVREAVLCHHLHVM